MVDIQAQLDDLCDCFTLNSHPAHLSLRLLSDKQQVTNQLNPGASLQTRRPREKARALSGSGSGSGNRHMACTNARLDHDKCTIRLSNRFLFQHGPPILRDLLIDVSCDGWAPNADL